MTKLLLIGILFLSLFALPSLASDRVQQVGDVITINGACTKDGVLSLLNGQKTGGMAGFRIAVQRAEEAGACRMLPQPVPVRVLEVEYFGLLDDGPNYILRVGAGLWIIDVVRGNGAGA